MDPGFSEGRFDLVSAEREPIEEVGGHAPPGKAFDEMIVGSLCI